MPAVRPKARKTTPNRRVTGKLDAPRTRKEKILFWLKWAGISSLAFLALSTTVLALLFWHYGRDPNLPSINKLSDYHPKQVSRVASADGKLVGELYTQRRTFVPYKKIPKSVVNAFVAAEDANFWNHKGIDYWGMFRALIVNLKARKKKQGASTITQQVVKTFLLSPERTFRRKFQEIILARRLENKLSKEEILTLYINQIYFGHGRYGVQEAARYYFGKKVHELNNGEAALLAGLPQGPELLSPRKHPKRAKRRQQYVLSQMAEHGYISRAEAKKWIDRPIEIIAEPFPFMGEAPEWVDVARIELEKKVGAEQVDTLATKVTTTLDMKIQRVAAKALRNGLHAHDKRHKLGRPIRRIKPDKIDLELAKLLRRRRKKAPEAGRIYPAVVLEVHEGSTKTAKEATKTDTSGELVVDLGKWKASVLLGGEADARINFEGKVASQRFRRGDLVEVVVPPKKEEPPEGHAPKHSERWVRFPEAAQGAVVVIDPHTRQVLALVGGYRTRPGDFNRAIHAKRQPGSSFKPFVYAAAIDTGDFSPASVVDDSPEVYNLWKPQNYKKGKFEGPVRLRYALAKSINTVAIKLLHDVGPERVATLAKDMGIESKLPTTLSLALGSGEVTPLEMTNAFATIAAGGRAAAPVFITKIGNQRVEAGPSREVLRPEVAYVVANMMRSVVTSGTGRRASKLRAEVVGKTGTSNDARDAWFMGMTSELVVGVWVGYDDNRPLGRREGGGKTAVPIFTELFAKVGKGQRARSFTMPPKVQRARIDKKTGDLAPENAPKGSYVDEVFVEGTVPTQTAPAPGQDDARSFVVDQYDDQYDDDEAGSGGEQ